MGMSLEQILETTPRGSPDETLAREVNFDALPSHIAIIMDGNGRWAAQRHLPRVEGHRAGIESVRDVVETSARLGIGALTLYAFSVENWKRPVTEVTALMTLLKRYLRLELDAINRNNIRFRVIGRTDELSGDVLQELEAGQEATARNTGMLFNIALNYGGRAEIVDAARRAIQAGVRPAGSRRAEVRRVPLHRGAARSGSADPDQRRDAGEQLPVVADRVCRNLGDRYALARLPPPPSPRGRARLSEARPPLRRHQPHASALTLVAQRNTRSMLPQHTERPKPRGCRNDQSHQRRGSAGRRDRGAVVPATDFSARHHRDRGRPRVRRVCRHRRESRRARVAARRQHCGCARLHGVRRPGYARGRRGRRRHARTLGARALRLGHAIGEWRRSAVGGDRSIRAYLHRVASRAARGHTLDAWQGSRAAADCHRGQQRHVSVLQRPHVRPALARARGEPEENHRRRDRRICRRGVEPRGHRTLVAAPDGPSGACRSRAGDCCGRHRRGSVRVAC